MFFYRQFKDNDKYASNLSGFDGLLLQNAKADLGKIIRPPESLWFRSLKFYMAR